MAESQQILKLKIFCILAMLLATGCKKDKAEKEIEFIPPTQMEMWDCHTQTVWHLQTVFDELVGKWKWIYQESFWAPGEGSNTEDENTIIEFRQDSVLNVFVNNQIVGTTNWIVIQIDPPLFNVSTDSIISQLPGRILFCDDLVEFNNSYIDGNDNYFKRIE